MKRFFALIIMIFSAVIFAFSQTVPREGASLDKIAAIVGDEIIMQSDIDGQLYFMSQYDKSIDVNDKNAKKKILESMIDNLLMVNRAKLDSIEVSAEEVNQRMELHLQSEVQRFGSEKRVEQVYGMSMPRIKNDIKEKIKQNLLVQNLVQIKFADIKVSQKEVEEFYDEKQDSLPVVPLAIELHHIVKKVKASSDQKKIAYDLAVKVRDSILSGGSFSDFAKNYSSDPGTVNSGGELGWFDKGKLFPEFEKAAFSLSTGELSMPVETPFGFHIIQTLEKRSDAINTRHILFKVGQSDTDVDDAIDKLKEIKQKVLNGESFESLAKQFSDDKETRGFGGLIGKLPISELPEPVKVLVDSLKEGGVSDPLPYKNDPTEPSYHIVYIKRFINEHKVNLKDDYREVELLAIEYKKRRLYSEWVDKLRQELYWEIKD
ncbi:MAG: peptidylprolyl isomerase [Candidatus Kapabacteria bacterium]|nr:peptidylprolyl isomerase [Ignavibacteriota bacterium]MCW5885483.1 peptidylprolyl isomerase [Candidatus Kapabacteria bacterium]